MGLSPAESWPGQESSGSASLFGDVVMVDFFFFKKEGLKSRCCFAGSAPKFCRALCVACDKANQK